MTDCSSVHAGLVTLLLQQKPHTCAHLRNIYSMINTHQQACEVHAAICIGEEQLHSCPLVVQEGTSGLVTTLLCMEKLVVLADNKA